DLPPDYGKWGSVHQRFIRWRKKGIWGNLLETLIDEPDYEWLMIDASHIKVHPHAAGAKGGNQEMSKTKGGSIPKYIWPWMGMVCQSESLLQKVPERIVKKLST
ncbi:transposase, partial [Clostridiaceae bacterium]|nr:transposase [Clostridiaceae bacterium]